MAKLRSIKRSNRRLSAAKKQFEDAATEAANAALEAATDAAGAAAGTVAGSATDVVDDLIDTIPWPITETISSTLPTRFDVPTEGVFAWMYGFAYGLQRDPQKPGMCYMAVETLLDDGQNIIGLLETVYLPETWGNLALGINDLSAIGASLFATCNLSQIFVTFTKICSC